MKKIILVILIIFSLSACASTKYMSDKEQRAKSKEYFTDFLELILYEPFVP